jgi:hypothetical protein
VTQVSVKEKKFFNYLLSPNSGPTWINERLLRLKMVRKHFYNRLVKEDDDKKTRACGGSAYVCLVVHKYMYRNTSFTIMAPVEYKFTNTTQRNPPTFRC